MEALGLVLRVEHRALRVGEHEIEINVVPPERDDVAKVSFGFMPIG
jgi:hypothetical protein